MWYLVSGLSCRILKYGLIFLGIFFVALGVIGIVIPGLPTTIFLILAAACFAKSSPCLHSWLMSHKWFGPIIYNWNETRSIPKRAKFLALLMMGLAAIYSSFMIDSWLIISCLLGLMLLPAIFVYRLPVSEELENTPADIK